MARVKAKASFELGVGFRRFRLVRFLIVARLRAEELVHGGACRNPNHERLHAGGTTTLQTLNHALYRCALQRHRTAARSTLLRTMSGDHRPDGPN